VIALIAACTLASAAEVRLDRVDLLSEAAPWVRQDAPRLGAAPGITTARWFAQVTPVASVGPAVVGVSLGWQWVGLRAPLVPERVIWADAAIVARGMLPVGGRVGVAWRPGRVRLGVSLAALSGATWVRPSWRSWSVVPTLGLGIGRDLRPKAPWMRSVE
jgi:hypothetical protein